MAGATAPAVCFGGSSFGGSAAFGSSPGGATRSATSDSPVSPFPYFRHCVFYCACSFCDLTRVPPPPNRSGAGRTNSTTERSVSSSGC